MIAIFKTDLPYNKSNKAKRRLPQIYDGNFKIIERKSAGFAKVKIKPKVQLTANYYAAPSRLCIPPKLASYPSNSVADWCREGSLGAELPRHSLQPLFNPQYNPLFGHESRPLVAFCQHLQASVTALKESPHVPFKDQLFGDETEDTQGRLEGEVVPHDRPVSKRFESMAVIH